MQVGDAVGRELHRLIEEKAPFMSAIRGAPPEVAGAPLVVAGDTRRGSVRGVVRGVERRCTVAGVLGYAPRPSAHPRRRPPEQLRSVGAPRGCHQHLGVSQARWPSDAGKVVSWKKRLHARVREDDLARSSRWSRAPPGISDTSESVPSRPVPSTCLGSAGSAARGVRDRPPPRGKVPCSWRRQTAPLRAR
jgi:hypothetical protein